MSATLPGLPPLVPVPLQQLADELVRRSYRMRLGQSADPVEPCELCGARRHPDAHISDPCATCGHVEERAAELRAAAVLVPYAVPVGDESDSFPF